MLRLRSEIRVILTALTWTLETKEQISPFLIFNKFKI